MALHDTLISVLFSQFIFTFYTSAVCWADRDISTQLRRNSVATNTKRKYLW